jgi:PAS domain S-box-containing protein
MPGGRHVKLSTRVALAMVALVLLTTVAVGWLSYRNVETVVLPRAFERAQIHVRLLATELASYAQGARDDILGFKSAVALQGIVRAHLAGGTDPTDGTTEAQWRQRMASRYAVELTAKPAYDLVRFISFDDGRELVRVDRFGGNGAVRVVPDDALAAKTDRKFFNAARNLPLDGIYVSPVELTPADSVTRAARMAVLRIAAVVPTPDRKPFGIVAINVDMRPILRDIAASAPPGSAIYVVDEAGNYLLHPDASREFGSDTGRPTQWRDDFPELVAAFDAGRTTALEIANGANAGAVAALASTRLAGGSRIGIVEVAPAAVIMAPAAAVARSTLVVGIAAFVLASALAILLARSLSRPLVQMTHAVEAFPHGEAAAIPADAGGEIGVLARAFRRMMEEVRDKTESLEREITEHRRTEAEREGHADRERLFSAAVQSSEDAIVTMTLDGIVTGWNPAAVRLLGYTADDMFGRSIETIVPADRRSEVREILEKIRSGDIVSHHETVRLKKDGGSVPISLSVSPIKAPSGAIIGACKIARDISDSKKAEEAIAQEVAERRRITEILDSTFNSMVDAVLVGDAQANILLANPAAERLMGITAGMSLTEWSNRQEIFIADGKTPLPLEQRPLMRAIRGETFANYDIAIRRLEGGKLVALRTTGAPLHRSTHAPGALVVYRDITDAKETERQLRQALKMEAVGQLTGGVAHDFNNILTVITGTIEILSEGVADRPNLAAITRMIEEATARGTELTRRLLAFSRRQPLEPRAINVNELIVDAGRLLRPTLGEHIEIEAMLSDNLAAALVDPNELTATLLNLALNARDAMPDGGKLTLETNNVFLDEDYTRNEAELQPGAYVMVAVSDTGTGISAAIVDKVFDPFFTTKEVGKGTGLGLSMVYGFVKQSGGHIKIYSEEGHGTTVKIYLPRAAEQAENAAEHTAPDALRGGSESVLVVEDDRLVRDYVVAQVKALGYDTLSATNAAEALALIDAGAAIDLLFTDIVMPGAMNGRELAEAAVKKRPGLKVLYTSGYTENAIVHHGRLDPGVLLLAKPYRKADLARMIRTALEATPKARPRAP